MEEMTIETRCFEEIQIETQNNWHLQHYIASLNGSVDAGEAVLLIEEVKLNDTLRSKVATIVRKESSSALLVNFYVFPKQNSIQVPSLPVPRKRTYVGYPTEVLQTSYVSVLSEDRIQALAYLIHEDDILSGLKAFSIGMSNVFFLRFRVDIQSRIQLWHGGVETPNNCQILTQQTWSIRRKLNRVIMEALNTSALSSTFSRHKTIDFAEWEWHYFCQFFGNPRSTKIGTVTLRVNRLDGAKESSKVKTKKESLQFTTTGEITKLKTVLGSMITVSARNGFPTAPKRIRAAETYALCKQTAGELEFVNAILPYDSDDDLPQAHKEKGFFFLWSREVEKLRVTTRWAKLAIAHDRVREELRSLKTGDLQNDDSDESSAEDESVEIQIGDDFPYQQAQFEVLGLVGDSHVQCIVIESIGGNWIVGQNRNFRNDFVREKMRDNY
jgi:hypothetical protein